MTCISHLDEDEKLLERLLSAGEYDHFDESVILEGEFVEFDATRHATRQVIVGFTPMNFVVAYRYIPSIRENLMLCPALFKVPEQKGNPKPEQKGASKPEPTGASKPEQTSATKSEQKGAPKPKQRGTLKPKHKGKSKSKAKLSIRREKDCNDNQQADGDTSLLKVPDENDTPMELADDFRETDYMLENLELSSVVHLKFMKIAFTDTEMNAYIGETKLRIYELCTTPLNGNIKEAWARWRCIAPAYIPTIKFTTSVVVKQESSASSESLVDIINAEIRKNSPWRDPLESDESVSSRLDNGSQPAPLIEPRSGTSQLDQEDSTMPIVKLFNRMRKRLSLMRL